LKKHGPQEPKASKAYEIELKKVRGVMEKLGIKQKL